MSKPRQVFPECLPIHRPPRRAARRGAAVWPDTAGGLVAPDTALWEHGALDQRKQFHVKLRGSGPGAEPSERMERNHDDGCTAWIPGVRPGIPRELRAVETIFRPECVFRSVDEVLELARLTGLPHEELTAFQAQQVAQAPAVEMAVANDLGFLEKCIRRIPVLNFVSRTSGILYLRYEDGKGLVVDGPTLAQVMDDPACADPICRLTTATLPAATHI